MTPHVREYHFLHRSKTVLRAIESYGTVGMKDASPLFESSLMQQWTRIVDSPVKRLGGFVVLVSVITIAACYDSIPTAPINRNPYSVNPRTHVAALPPSSASLPPAPGSKVFIQTYPFVEEVVVEGKITGTVEITSHTLAQFLELPRFGGHLAA